MIEFDKFTGIILHQLLPLYGSCRIVSLCISGMPLVWFSSYFQYLKLTSIYISLSFLKPGFWLATLNQDSFKNPIFIRCAII